MTMFSDYKEIQLLGAVSFLIDNFNIRSAKYADYAWC